MADELSKGAVLPWRLAVGISLHLVIPAYMLTLGVAWLAEGTPTHGLLGEALRISWRFLLAYLALTLTAASLARVLDPSLRRRRAKRETEDPALAARRSASQVVDATARAARLGGAGPEGERVAAAVAVLRRGAWDHCDVRDRKLSADLHAATHAFAAAHWSASPARRPEIAALAAASLERVAAALEELATERRRLDEGDALTHARYLDARYGPTLDSAGSSSG